MVLTIAVFLPACTVLQTLGRSRAEAELSPSKVVAPVPTPVPASPVIVTPSARPQKVEAEQDAEDSEEVEDGEDTEGAASSEVVPQPVPLPSTGMIEGAPVPGLEHPSMSL